MISPAPGLYDIPAFTDDVEETSSGSDIMTLHPSHPGADIRDSNWVIRRLRLIAS